ncbi:MAG: MFS transporter [Thermoflexales bacterium]|nr:MFS transporter [Thermoflexales bacterium]
MSKPKVRRRPPARHARCFRSLRALGTRLQQHTLQITAGGRWTDRLSTPVRQNLRWFWFDGLFANASDAAIVDYLPLFVLALGATRGQIGLMSALANLSGALLLLPGAALVERLGHRKHIAVLSGGGMGRLTLPLLALLPLLVGNPAVIWLAVALVVARSAFGNLGLPAWTSLTADIVPLTWRGRYFSTRNIAMGVAGMATTYLVGQLITRIGGLSGYQWALGLAFVLGIISSYCFNRIDEPQATASTSGSMPKTRQPILHHLRTHRDFVVFCATAALWNLALNVAGPFFNVYLVENLNATASVVGTLSVLTSLTALPGQRLFGLLADRWGPRRVQLITGLLIPPLPMAWVFIRSPWHVAPINIASGFLWAGFNLASFNMLLAITPEDRRARYTAWYQIVVMLSLAAGAVLGGAIAETWGYSAIFILSSLGRLGAMLLFARFVHTS